MASTTPWRLRATAKPHSSPTTRWPTTRTSTRSASPDAAANDANATVTLIANYIPFELPQGGPNYNTFGENIRYEIHVKNDATTTTGDDIIYRFTFTGTNQDPTTFFRVRLGKENLKTTYRMDVIRRWRYY
ncbi:MAG: DUF4331 family protein [Hymenobacter sp.]